MGLGWVFAVGDLPPATPEEESEEEEEEESGGKGRRKRGRPSRASELGEVEEEEGDEDDASGSGGSIIEYSDGEGGQQPQDDQEEGNVGTARRTSHFPPSMQFPDAHLPQRPYPPSQSNFDNRLHEYDDDDGEEGGHEDLRRMSTFSSRSVEAARRLSFATSLGGSPGAMGFDGEDSFVRRGSFMSEGASMRGRVSEIGFEGFGDDRSVCFTRKGRMSGQGG